MLGHLKRQGEVQHEMVRSLASIRNWLRFVGWVVILAIVATVGSFALVTVDLPSEPTDVQLPRDPRPGPSTD
ncbi:MAG: hypothetical protein WD403_07630 [Pirellulales bacterium]